MSYRIYQTPPVFTLFMKKYKQTLQDYDMLTKITYKHFIVVVCLDTSHNTGMLAHIYTSVLWYVYTQDKYTYHNTNMLAHIHFSIMVCLHTAHSTQAIVVVCLHTPKILTYTYHTSKTYTHQGIMICLHIS